MILNWSVPKDISPLLVIVFFFPEASYLIAWRTKNVEKIRQYRIKNRSRIKKNYSKWLVKNKDKVKARQIKWYIKNRERLLKKSSEYAKNNSIRISERRRKYRIEHRERLLAGKAVYRAIKNGSLIRLPCVVCAKPKSEAHHDDYSKPLQVVWLCRAHHAKADVNRRNKENNL